ncbi:NADPH-dependent 7-cyano-7-deazaguanine reductase [Achromobacter denitrificans]|uniref:NADPH-dependent 7-cyano-7-deazaguanine reductase n=1 Tax=Achromobacter denitrificans TaxID=32002 RepID=A0A6J5H6E9_ACHDE|nr:MULTISPECIES: NADPH-dependent 7-cyano-7-deazaguanine reductase QueF [Achromobacter]ASC66750.1 NADPH-dependent 7-cyano-7-deazaguanine reductase QueF [Achromobacter denitrificans]MDF3856732.1 NADPH-dependent 7-cyano-7-deazaguanine reductase QueF [Achromobacter denitrificans]MDF3943836.1 NADPH-dependent 7-cyano-7-deazaguanine reductase QueF [Achromobacter denitrificans]OLU07261.1 NADPH-dependent 7-cyano-7-deazaguanine reductase QueF [Achromobacter denitrificans]QKH42164.1 NADPH-dependent 7-cya
MTLSHGPLGQSVSYVSQYDPTLLFPIARSHNRAALNLADDKLPFTGVDLWNAYELSWLDAKGKPRIAMATFSVPADSPNIIESKSFKLYLNSFNQTRLVNSAALRGRLERDLSAAAGAPVGLDFFLPQRFSELQMGELDGIYIDKLDIEIDTYEPAPEVLRTRPGDMVEETLASRLLKSNCPVTGQPDWASVQIRYRGAPIDRESLLRYIVSFRQHAEFHEHCVERIYTDIMHACRPELLTVYARYTRRGGLDINPWRSNFEAAPPADLRTVRQ